MGPDTVCMEICEFKNAVRLVTSVSWVSSILSDYTETERDTEISKTTDHQFIGSHP